MQALPLAVAARPHLAAPRWAGWRLHTRHAPRQLPRCPILRDDARGNTYQNTAVLDCRLPHTLVVFCASL